MTEEQQQPLIPMSPGECLRHAREQRRLSVDEVARRLRCSPEVVTAIESDNHARLAPIYRRGFLRAYAEFLGIDPEEFSDFRAADEESPPLQSVFPEARTVQSSDRWLRAASYALASLLVGTLAWQLTHEAVRLAKLDDAADARAGAVVEPAPHVNASIASLESLRPPAGARAGAGREAWEAVESATRNGDALSDGEHLIELRASADSWVEITGADGRRLERDLLRGGDVRSYRGAGPFDVSLGRSSAIQLFLDGRIVDLAPHTREDVTRMVLDPDRTVGADSGSPAPDES